MLNGDLLRFTAQNHEMLFVSFGGLSSVSGNTTQIINSSILIRVLLILIPAITIVSIFLFRKRPIQKTAVLAVIIAALCLIIIEGYYWNLVAGKYNGVLLPGMKMIIPVLIIILAILAYLGIKKDEDIIKSYDRLR
jgi:hypothetical protein